MSRTTPNSSLLVARERFFSSGERPTGLISKIILESWQRCAALGLSARLRPEVERLPASALHELLDRHESLRRLCRNELEALHASARAGGAIAILTAPDGLILDAVGDAAFLDKAARVSLRPGVPWREDATGTNAIGTALIERRAVEVRGGEHYFEPYRILSCSAAPILDPFGRLAGALDLSGEANVHHVHALGLVQLAVDQIEHRLFDDVCAERELIRLHSDPSLLGTPREGVLMFEGHRLVAANRYALALLGLDWEELGRRRYDELFSGAMPRSNAIAGLRDHFGNVLHARRQLPGARVSSNGPTRCTRRTLKPVVDAALQAQLERAVRLINADIPVLLQGETGTGKEVFARALHQRCARMSSAFVAINCAALPESLIESELFGYAPGAFTGARREGSVGLLREADGGVLFLDEIGDMPLPLQSRLLRVLQEREVVALGSSRAAPVDFALIAASHHDLRVAVEAGAFRADLYYRIAQSQVRLPPLREHADLRTLIAQLWTSLTADDTRLRLGESAAAELAAYSWPGNFRQLVAVLRELIALAQPGSTIGREALPELVDAKLAATGSRIVPGKIARLDTIERDAMRQALAATGGNTSEAARRLGVSRSTLYRRLRDYD
ncbi:MAG: sigma-54-dependent Fis family transcriptional regulator [Dokdonella sp.]